MRTRSTSSGSRGLPPSRTSGSTCGLTNDPKTSTFHLGATQPVLPGGRLTKNGRNVNRLSVDTTLLSRYGAEQAKKGRQIMLAHGGDVFAKPGASCQVLKNGAIRLR